MQSDAVMCERCEFEEYPFRLTNRFGKTVQSKFFASRRQPHAQPLFNQLEMLIVVAEQNGGIGAFSEFELTHERELVSLQQIDKV
jgi:hypothetical protein